MGGTQEIKVVDMLKAPELNKYLVVIAATSEGVLSADIEVKFKRVNDPHLQFVMAECEEEALCVVLPHLIDSPWGFNEIRDNLYSADIKIGVFKVPADIPRSDDDEEVKQELKKYAVVFMCLESEPSSSPGDIVFDGLHDLDVKFVTGTNERNALDVAAPNSFPEMRGEGPLSELRENSRNDAHIDFQVVELPPDSGYSLPPAESDESTPALPPVARYVKAPEYNRAKVDEILGVIRTLAEFTEDHPGIVNVKINLSSDDLLILNDMLYEMDRHLPDFFEGLE